MSDYGSLLRSGKMKLGVWGAGYIGFSSMIFFARKGVSCVGYDVVPDKVEAINRGQYIFRELENWLRFPLKPLLRKGLISGTTDHGRLLEDDILVHLIAVPTERNGAPYFAHLRDVLSKLRPLRGRKVNHPPLVIVESTLSPRSSEKIVFPTLKRHRIRVGLDILYGVAPRRDWFVWGGKNLADLDRVFGGVDAVSTRQMRSVLSIPCKKLHQASDHQVAEMVKSFENAYRHVDITLANQLSLGYPKENVREALKLVGTKWNIGTFFPGFGSGGYCIPISSKYVLQGAEHPEAIGILESTLKTDQKINRVIGRSLLKRGFKRIGVLGLAYKENLKVGILSPTIPFVAELMKGGADVRVHDPHFDADEIRDMTGAMSFRFPDELEKFEAVVLVVPHDEYCKIKGRKLTRHFKRCQFVLDTPGVWSDHFRGAENIEYHISGDGKWLG